MPRNDFALMLFSADVETAAVRNGIDCELVMGRDAEVTGSAVSYSLSYLAFCAVELSVSVMSLRHRTTVYLAM
jgi:hypothetical protein